MEHPVSVTEIRNYESVMPLQAGSIAGFTGSLSIMAVVTAILLVSGKDIWTAARLIAAVVYGPDAGNGIGTIAAGTIIHLITGTLLGGLFARFMPCLPRSIWIVAGLVYGIAAWAISTFAILPFVAPLLVATSINISVLFVTHVVYGFTLGIAGATYGLIWKLPNQ